MDIERILGFPLPSSARKYRAWWGNDGNSPGRQARAWIEGGWNTRDIDISNESLVFVRVSDSSYPERRERVALSRKGNPNHLHGAFHRVSSGASGRYKLLDYIFVHAAVIDPERDASGGPLEFMPQSRYRLADTTQLNQHGTGPFCRFALKGLPAAPGVYALTIRSELAYVGKAKDLAQRWGPQGYATISPKNCYVGGQSTNCKINNKILLAARESQRIDLWIYETPDPELIEGKLIAELDPPWNDQKPLAR